jgi:miniconductance mechanosensitive channel
MDIDLKHWLGANLGTNDIASTAILIGIAMVGVLAVWWLSKKTLIAVIPKLTAKTVTLWDDIIFNKRILQSLATLIPALVLYHVLPMLFDASSGVLPYIVAATDIIVILVSVWIITSFFNSINEILSQKDKYKDKPIGSGKSMKVEIFYLINFLR